ARGAVRALGGAATGRFPVRTEAERAPALRLRHLCGARAAARRAARADPRRRGVGSRRGPARAPARLVRPVGPTGARPAARLVGRNRARAAAQRRPCERARERCALPLPAPARAALLGRRPARLDRKATAAAGRRRTRLLL